MKLLTIGPITVPRSKFVAAIWGALGRHQVAGLSVELAEGKSVQIATDEWVSSTSEWKTALRDDDALFVLPNGVVDITKVVSVWTDGTTIHFGFLYGENGPYGYVLESREKAVEALARARDKLAKLGPRHTEVAHLARPHQYFPERVFLVIRSGIREPHHLTGFADPAGLFMTRGEAENFIAQSQESDRELECERGAPKDSYNITEVSTFGTLKTIVERLTLARDPSEVPF